MARFSLILLLLTTIISSGTSFSVRQPNSSPTSSTTPPPTKADTHTLGLLTFDLDDSLYPIQKVEEEANHAFVKSMEQYGFTGLVASDIVTAAMEIRAEGNPAMTHNELRLAAIRREMERITVERKLQACANDWATTVDSLSNLVVENSKKWAQAAVHENIVRAVNTAWEMERHHSAERHLYPEVLDALRDIRAQHPTAIVGAVTDGRSNPLFMTFTLAPYFDFRCSWEDDQGKRQEFFQQLDNTGGDTAQLGWIYDEARFKYAELKEAADGIQQGNVAVATSSGTTGSGTTDEQERLVFPETYDDRVWIHVGDDLAFDVGGAAACGAKTIYLALDEKRYGQSARFRYTDDTGHAKSSWSTTPTKELEKRFEMAQAAEEKVDMTLQFLSTLPDAINDILKKGNY